MRFLLFLAVSGTARIAAQELSKEVQAVYDACLRMRSAIEAGSATALRAAGKAFKLCEVRDFGNLRCMTRPSLSLDGHFVFDDVFVDSLVAGLDVYRFSQRYADAGIQRGVMNNGKVCVKNGAVRKDSRVKYSFTSKKIQELVVVTEPGGMVSLRVFDKTNGRWYNDTEKVNAGKAVRVLVMELPEEKRNLLELEIINRSRKDISFVIISN